MLIGPFGSATRMLGNRLGTTSFFNKQGTGLVELVPASIAFPPRGESVSDQFDEWLRGTLAENKRSGLTTVVCGDLLYLLPSAVHRGMRVGVYLPDPSQYFGFIAGTCPDYASTAHVTSALAELPFQLAGQPHASWSLIAEMQYQSYLTLMSSSAGEQCLISREPTDLVGYTADVDRLLPVHFEDGSVPDPAARAQIRPWSGSLATPYKWNT